MSPLGLSWLSFCALAVLIAAVLQRISIDRSGVSLFSSGGLRSAARAGNLISQPLFLVSLVFNTAMLLWLWLVSTGLSVAYPVLASLTFVTVTVVGTFVFAEPFSARKGVGLVSIVIGLSLVSIA